MLTGVPRFMGFNSTDIIVEICSERVPNASKLELPSDSAESEPRQSAS
jgi:hypothetical protein